MRQDQLALAAELLNMNQELASERAGDVGDGIVRLSSHIRGLGSVLVGPDLSVMFFPSYISTEQALQIWKTGKRTPRESFDALHTLEDGTRRPQSER